MTGSSFRHEEVDAATVAATVSRTGGRHPLSLLTAAVLVLEAAEAFEVQDGQYFGIVNSSVPFAKVHLVMTESSRFVLNVDLTKDELYGKFSFTFLEPVKGKKLTALTLDNVTGTNLMFASSRMDLGGRTAAASLSYTLQNGTLLVNATIVITPFSYTGETFCENNWDCRRFMSNCTKGRCECGAGNRFQRRELYCTKICKDKAECTAAGGTRNSECLLDKCTCIVGTVLVGGICGYPRGCIEDSTCTSGSICEDTRCVCPTGSLRVGSSNAAGCERHACTDDADCGFWLYAQCARIRPGSTRKGCRCAKDTALLFGSCNPIDNLGPCPYGHCTIEYSECDQSTSLCRCQNGYELRIYGNTWICEKQDTATVERACMESTQCYPGEICDEGFCKCPKGKELSRDLACVAIKLPKTSNNLRLFLWLSAAMLALIVVFITFGGCLYLLAQRAENEQMEIAKMFDQTEESVI